MSFLLLNKQARSIDSGGAYKKSERLQRRQQQATGAHTSRMISASLEVPSLVQSNLSSSMPVGSSSATIMAQMISGGVGGRASATQPAATSSVPLTRRKRLEQEMLSRRQAKSDDTSATSPKRVKLIEQTGGQTGRCRPEQIVTTNCNNHRLAPESADFETDELACSCDLGNNNNNNNNNNESSWKDDDASRLRQRQQQQQQQEDQNHPVASSRGARLSPVRAKRALSFKSSAIQTLGQLGERNGRGICNKHMPWFGIDVGGSLVKVVFFDPKEATSDELVTLRRIRQYLRSSKPYGSTGRRDAHLEMPNCLINRRAGSLHFIRFATSEMPEFLAMAKNKRFADTLDRTICATGGGACKFEHDIRENLGIKIHKTDELDSIIYGIHYIDKYNSDRECYFLKNPLDDEHCVKVPYDFSRPYPYLVVNIGSGVSILAVYSSTSYSRISGSSIGGGTFLGLCSLLTQCETFDEAIRLAKAGSSSKIDKLVKDIYGGDYAKFNLSGDTVASSFGHMNMAEKRKEVTREDLARALLEMVTINIGSIARMCAVNEGIDRVVFIGNFLRVNQLSMRLLSYAVNYWSAGAIKALFLEHEGYFGAVGCFVESTQGCHDC